MKSQVHGEKRGRAVRHQQTPVGVGAAYRVRAKARPGLPPPSHMRSPLHSLSRSSLGACSVPGTNRRCQAAGRSGGRDSLGVNPASASDLRRLKACDSLSVPVSLSVRGPRSSASVQGCGRRVTGPGKVLETEAAAVQPRSHLSPSVLPCCPAILPIPPARTARSSPGCTRCEGGSFASNRAVTGKRKPALICLECFSLLHLDVGASCPPTR